MRAEFTYFLGPAVEPVAADGRASSLLAAQSAIAAFSVIVSCLHLTGYSDLFVNFSAMLSLFYHVCILSIHRTVTVWRRRNWQRVGLDQRSYSTSGPVSTGMGDRSGV